MKQNTHIQFQLVTMYYEKLKTIVDYFMRFLRTCLLATLNGLTLIYIIYIKKKTKLFVTWSKDAFFSSNKLILQFPFKLNMHTIAIFLTWPSLRAAGWASECDHTGQDKCSADPLCPPPPFLVRPLVLVILLGECSGYLFLHQSQLIAQAVVGFHELLDLGFRGRECVLHFNEFLHSYRAIRLVRVQALCSVSFA